MVNLKIDWKVPKAACLVKLKRDKDKSVDLPPPLSVVLIFPRQAYEREHNKFPPCGGQGGGEGYRGRAGQQQTEDLQHLALSIYITSFHKESMDHSSGLVLAVSGKAIGCQGVCAFHISL